MAERGGWEVQEEVEREGPKLLARTDGEHRPVSAGLALGPSSKTDWMATNEPNWATDLRLRCQGRRR